MHADDKDRILAGTDAGELLVTEGLEAKPPIQLGFALRTLSCFGKVWAPHPSALRGCGIAVTCCSPLLLLLSCKLRGIR